MNLFRVSFTLIAVLVMFVGKSEARAELPRISRCQMTVAEVDEAVTHCFDRFSVRNLQFVIPYFCNQHILEQLCSEQTGILECLTESIGFCTSNATHMLYNVDNFRNVIDSVCKNELYTVLAYKNCLAEIKSKSGKCLQNLRLNVHNVMKEKGTDMKTNICRVYLQMADCMAISPVGSCTNENAQFVNSNFVTQYSLRGCNITESDVTSASLEPLPAITGSDTSTLPSKSAAAVLCFPRDSCIVAFNSLLLYFIAI